jgi:hypothetical protein
MLAGHPKKKEREMLNIVSEKAATCRGKIIGGGRDTGEIYSTLGLPFYGLCTKGGE